MREQIGSSLQTGTTNIIAFSKSGRLSRITSLNLLSLHSTVKQAQLLKASLPKPAMPSDVAELEIRVNKVCLEVFGDFRSECLWSEKSERRSREEEQRGGAEGRSSEEEQRGKAEGRSRGEEQRGGAKGRSRGEEQRGGAEGRSREEEQKGGAEGRSRREEQRGGAEGRSRGEEQRKRHSNLLQVRVPRDETTYWCEVQPLPRLLSKHHVVKVTALKTILHESIVA